MHGEARRIVGEDAGAQRPDPHTVGVLEEAHYAWKAGALKGLPRRDHALLLAARFDYAMSAFHLHALSLYMQEIERFRPPDFPKHVLQYVVTYVPTIRMSDVLDGYEKRVLPDAGEVEFAPPPPSCASSASQQAAAAYNRLV